MTFQTVFEWLGSEDRLYFGTIPYVVFSRFLEREKQV